MRAVLGLFSTKAGGWGQQRGCHFLRGWREAGGRKSHWLLSSGRGVRSVELGQAPSCSPAPASSDCLVWGAWEVGAPCPTHAGKIKASRGMQAVLGGQGCVAQSVSEALVSAAGGWPLIWLEGLLAAFQHVAFVFLGATKACPRKKRPNLKEFSQVHLSQTDDIAGKQELRCSRE